MDEVIDAFPGVMSEDLDGPILPLEPVRPAVADMADMAGDISGLFSVEELGTIGAEVCEDYDRDKADRKEWADIASDALELAAQEKKGTVKNYPWPGCANVQFPLLTTAALQFNARAMPAILKGDEAISAKVVGQDKGRPEIGPGGVPVVEIPDPATGLMVKGLASAIPPGMEQMAKPVWLVPPGGKAARAQRVAEYLNTVLFYRMDDWESDTDTLLMQLPIVGCVFRKVWYDPLARKQCAVMVPALRIVVPEGARGVNTTPRLTEELCDVYPHEINEKQRSGFYRDIILDDEDSEERAGARLLLEQHRLMDLDGDGLEEPYIVTVDHVTQRVLRIEANYSPEDVMVDAEGRIVSIKRGQFYAKYDFFPHPDGKFYGIGLGHLLSQLGAVINAAINQLIDAGTAQTAGGGFVASGVRFQGRSSSMRFTPGEYKTVDVSGAVLRDGIVERTLPNVSPVTFQILDLILGAARDISGIKDVITGDASNNGQVGTTLALIEQGLQVFNAVYKRIYRALKTEFTLIYSNVSKFGGEDAARDYAEIMDDQSAQFEQDFNQTDMDIRPVSDPSSVTRMQKMARAQALLQTIQFPGANPIAILKRVYEAMDVENPDELIMEPPPPEPNPKDVAQAEKYQAGAQRDIAEANKTTAETVMVTLDAQTKAAEAGFALG